MNVTMYSPLQHWMCAAEESSLVHETRAKEASVTGVRAIWPPPRDVGPRGARVYSALGPPSDMDPPLFWTTMHIK